MTGEEVGPRDGSAGERSGGKAELPGESSPNSTSASGAFSSTATIRTSCGLRPCRLSHTPANRRTVYGPIVDLNELRNRVAHHEPVHSRNLAQHHQDLLAVAAMIDPDIADWISGLSRVPPILAARP